MKKWTDTKACQSMLHCDSCLHDPKFRVAVSDRYIFPESCPSSSCPPHADWCERYGLPTDATQCATCTAARAAADAEYLQAMRARGLAYGRAACAHREQTGETVERRCCGGSVKRLPVYRCARDGTTPSPCAACRSTQGGNRPAQ